MVTENFDKNIPDKLAKVTISIGKPNKEGKRGVGVEYTVSMKDTETEEEYKKRFAWVKTLAENEIR